MDKQKVRDKVMQDIAMREEQEKMLSEAKVVKEEGDRQFLKVKGGGLCVRLKDTKPDQCFGDYVKLPLNPTEEDIQKAREELIENMAELIRVVATEKPEWVFIEKDFEDCHTVGCKIVFPAIGK